MKSNRTAALALLSLVAACHGDRTASNGELGRLSYALHTDYESEQDELTALPLLTGYAHRIDVELTTKGADDADDNAGLLEHTAEGVDGVEIESDEPSEGSGVPGFDLLSPESGEVVITSTLQGETFDLIRLQFERPTSLDVLGWSRAAWEEDWRSFSGGNLTVQEGAQISFLAVPKAGETRLGGEFTPTITVDPPSLAVPDESVLAVQEGGMTTGGEPVTFFAIEPGTATFTLTDPVNGVEAVTVVEIAPFSSM